MVMEINLKTSKELCRRLHNSGPSDWDTEKIVQRQSINEGDSISTIFEDWPFFSEPFGILCHFKNLVGIDCEAAIREGCDSKGVRLQRYFSSEMRGELDPLFREAQKEAENNDNIKAWVPAHLMCVMKCLHEKPEALFLQVDETSSVAEVERDNTESWPRLVILGESYLSAKQCMIILDHKVILRSITSFLKIKSIKVVQPLPWSSFKGASAKSIRTRDARQTESESLQALTPRC